MIDSMYVVNYSIFQLTWLASDGMLNKEWISHALHFYQMFEKWSNILGPKHKTLHAFRSQIDRVDLLAIGIGHLAVASFQTVHKPFAIEGGYICFIAR